MSNLLEQASLVLIPSGYKEDVVYSEIPLDGSGDLQFTRSSNGTRINSQGLVEVCPWNLALQSETFDNASWSKITGGTSTVTVTANNGTAPNGTNTADRIQLTRDSSGFAQVIQTITTTASQSYTFSVYLKSLSGTPTVMFGSYGGTNAQTATLTNEWVRYTWTATSPSTSAFGMLMIWGGVASTSLSADFLAWGYQLVEGSTAKPYFPTTDRLNVPRLTYQNGGGGCPSLLLEKQSTNLAYPSEDFTNVNWAASNLTVTANDATSPDGTQNADKLVTTSTSIENQVRFGTFAILGNVGSSYTVSVFAKKGTADFLRIRNLFVQGGDTSGNAWFNLSTGAVGTVQASQTASIQNMGNGWYRCILTGVVGSSSNYNFVDIGFTNTDGTNWPSTSVNGYVYGAQLEASSYATSYIVSTSSSATRVADLATVNLPNTNMTFTAYLELDEASLGTPAGDWFSIFSNVSALGRAYGYANQFGFADAYSLGVSSGTKMVWKQESGSTAKIFKGGALVGTSTTGTYTDPFNRLRIDGALLDKPVKIKQFVFFDNALTDAECIQLTA